MPTRTTEKIELPVVSPGTHREMKVIRYGTSGNRPKAYLQTALHADEIPGMLVMHHLDRLLRKADESGNVCGEIVLVPVANPIGLGQYIHGHMSGRFELNSGVNFNRDYSDVTDAVAKRIQNELSDDVTRNVASIRKAIVAVVDELPTPDEMSFMRKILLGLAGDADICLDLHCDGEAVLHVYLGTPLWPEATDLSAQLGSKATLLAEVSGGNPFDEAVGGVWWALQKRFPGSPIPPACLSATVELRGGRDISHDQAAEDADNLFKFLVRRGLISGDAGLLPELLAPATPLEGVDSVKATSAGVVVYLKKPGDAIEVGEAVAEIIDPVSDSIDNSIVVLRSRVSGILYAHRLGRFTRPGQTLCRIAGARALPDRVGGDLLSD